MFKIRKIRKQNAEVLGDDLQASTRRHFCTRLSFWTACGDKPCRRAHACVGDANKCFLQFWPMVPEEMKVGIRAGINAKHAGLSKPQMLAEIARELERWLKLMGPQENEPVSQSQPIAPAASGPRARVL